MFVRGRFKRGDPPRAKVLLIDDDLLVGRSLRRALYGYAVTLIQDPCEAPALCRDNDFDVIVCDFMMPELDGERLFKLLIAQDPTISPKVIFMTGGVFTPRSQAFLDGAVNPVLAKPFAPAVLQEAVERVLVRQQRVAQPPATPQQLDAV